MARKKLTHLQKLQFIFSLVIRLSILIAIWGALVNRRWTIVFVSALALFLTFLPAILRRNYEIVLPAEFEIVMVIFIYTSLFLGEVHNYYTLFWWWDVVLHTGSGLILGFVGFLILFVLYKERKISAKPITIAFFSFCFALSIGTVWEIFEFSMDHAFRMNMQKSGLVDTMWDLIVDALGALFTSVIGFLYIKGGKSFLFERLVNRFIVANPKLYGMGKKE